MRFIICLMAMLVVPSVVMAQCGVIRRGPVTYHTPVTYHAPVVKEVVKVVPVAVPIYIPTFTYQYVPPPCHAVPAAPVAPVGSPVTPVGSPVGSPVGQQQGNPLDKDEQIRALAKALLAEMAKQAENGGDTGPPAAPDLGGPAPAPTPGDWVTSLSNRCAECHTGPRSKGGVQIFAGPGQLNPLLPKQKVIDAIQSRRMPPPNRDDGSPLPQMTPEEMQAILQGLSR